MSTHIRFTPVLALFGALALGAAPAARAQDTSSVQADTSVQGYGAGAAADTFHAQNNGQTGQADTGAAGYHGPPTDTALKAKPGVQTGPSAADSSEVGQSSRPGATPADTVVCKDGSNAARSGSPCLNHGGIDWTATEAALKARGENPSGTGDSASADTALRAKPGVQTGPTDSSAAARADSSGQ